MSTLNQAVNVIEDLSPEDKQNLISILFHKYKDKIEQELIDDYNDTKFLYETGTLKPQTVNELFEHLSI